MASTVDESVLNTIKKMLGPDASYTAFDTDVIVHINTALMTLQQLGVGPEEGFLITGEDEEWTDFIPKGKMLEAAKTYIYLCVKLVFDPPTNSFVVTAMNEERKMLEYRLREQGRFFNAIEGKYVDPDQQNESGDG